MTDYGIREGSRADIAGMIRVFRRSIRESASADYVADQITAWARRGTEERFLKLFEDGLRFWVAENRMHEVIGYSAVKADGYLHSLFVRPDFQRQGIAGKLLQKAFEYCAVAEAEQIFVEASITALPFFFQAGFNIEKSQDVCVDGIFLRNHVMSLQLTALHKK